MERFEGWDGKRVADLRAAADALEPSDYAGLIAACYADDTKTVRAASWVLKAAYEAGADIAFPPMLRAWALDAYVRLGGSDSDALIAAAANDPAASVRARARNLVKKQ